MRKIVLGFVLSLSLLLVNGCFSSEKKLVCGGDSIKQTAISLVKDDFKDTYLLVVVMESGSENIISHYIFKNMKTYKQWLSHKEHEEVGNMLKKLDEQVEAMEINIENIRLDFKDPKIKKIVCLADATLKNGKKSPVRYTVQETEEGKIIVVLNQGIKVQ